ncbi:unnamed protein product [Chrysoparadoxa australica]
MVSPITNPSNYPSVGEIAYRGKGVAVACAEGNLPVLALLRDMAEEFGRDLTAPDADGCSLVHYAALASSADVLNWLLLRYGQDQVSLVNADGETPLLRAAVEGHIEVIECLLNAGADLMAKDASNNSCLHNSARHGQTWALVYLMGRVRQAYGKEALKALLLAGDKDGHPPLSWACYMGHLPVVRVLLREGLDPFATDESGKSCLHWAVSQGQLEVARYLVGLGVPTGEKDMSGQTPLDYSMHLDSVLKKSLQAVLNKRPVRLSLKDGGELKTFEEKIEKLEPQLLPRRINSTRVGIVASIALPVCGLWSLSLAVPWWACCLLIWPFAAGLCRALWHARWAAFQTVLGAPERYLAIWVGLACCFVVWMCLTAVRHSRGDLDYPCHSLFEDPLPAAWAALALFCVTVLLWFDLVVVHQDAGVIKPRGEDFTALAALVRVSSGPPDKRQFCSTCLVRKPLRSKHCARCGTCVSRMDHHCAWLNNCVGVANHRTFAAFVICHTLFLMVWLALLAVALQAELAPEGACPVLGQLLSRDYFPLFCLGIIGLLALIIVAVVSFEQLRNAAENITTNERMNKARYPWLQAAVGGRFFNHFQHPSCYANCAEFWQLPRKSPHQDYTRCFELPQLSAEQQRKLAQASLGDSKHATRPRALSLGGDALNTSHLFSPLRHSLASIGGITREPAV